MTEVNMLRIIDCVYFDTAKSICMLISQLSIPLTNLLETVLLKIT
jgi:hypothetical protein